MGALDALRGQLLARAGALLDERVAKHLDAVCAASASPADEARNDHPSIRLRRRVARAVRRSVGGSVHDRDFRHTSLVGIRGVDGAAVFVPDWR